MGSDEAMVSRTFRYMNVQTATDSAIYVMFASKSMEFEVI
jgi:hypothetical protein